MQAFQLDPRSPVPVTLQLTGQIKHQIRAGLLQPGDQLPSLRDLAAALGVNRNTVVKAFADLEAAGFLRSHPGKGIFVAQDYPGPQRSAEMRALVAGALQQAADLGLDAEEFALAVLAQGQLARPPEVPRYRVLAMTGSRERLGQLTGALERALPLVATGVLPDELHLRFPGGAGLDGFRLAVTTAFHAAEARQVLAGALPVFVVGPQVEQYLSQLAGTAPQAAVTVRAPDWVHAARIRRGLDAAGLGHLNPWLAVGPGEPALLLGLEEMPEPIDLAPDDLDELRQTLAIPPEDRRRTVSPWF